jgi:nicotinamide riboside kinase
MTTPIKRIYIVGPSSTGKTTLCAALARRLGLDASFCVTEVARDVMRRTGLTRADVGTLAMQRAILDAQLKREEDVATRCAGSPSPVMLSDRSGVDPVVYAVLTASDMEDGIERQSLLVETSQFQRILLDYRSACFILLLPVPEWLVDDGVRSLNDGQRCAEVFRGLLNALNIPCREIGPELRGIEERVDAVLDQLEKPSQ